MSAIQYILNKHNRGMTIVGRTEANAQKHFMNLRYDNLIQLFK